MTKILKRDKTELNTGGINFKSVEFHGVVNSWYMHMCVSRFLQILCTDTLLPHTQHTPLIIKSKRSIFLKIALSVIAVLLEYSRK